MNGYLIDTNVLVRLVLPHDPLCAVAGTALDELKRQRKTVCIAAQNLIEFWSVASRPVEVNGLGMEPVKVASEVDRIEKLFPILNDRASVYRRWRTLVEAYAVSGRQVHDTRLVALMLEHGIGQILTFNVDDFTRYSEIETVSPKTLVPGPPRPND